MLIATTGVDATSYSSTGLNAATSYYYRVSAYNSRGSSSYSNLASATTAPNSIPSCTYSISPTSASFPSGAGNGSSSVAAGSSCVWTATSAATWITITAGSGSGSGTATYSVAVNTSTSSRTGTFIIAGQMFTVSQAAAAASGPANDYFANGIVTSGSSAILTGSNAGATKEASEPNHGGNAGGKSIWWSWTAPSAGSVTINTLGSSFDTLLGVYTGTAVSSLTTIASNDDIGSGVLQSTATFNAVAGTTYQIAVDGYNGASGNITLNLSQTVPSCSYSISLVSTSVSSAGASGNVSVTTGTGCSWTATSGANWITITAGASGSGIGTVSYTVAANTATASRTGSLTIAGQTFTVTQAGVACNYSIGGSTASFGSAGGPGSVGVSAGSICTWTASSSVSWITTTSSGTGIGTANYSVAANTATSSRTGTLTIAGQPFTVSQTAATPDNPPTASLTSPANGATISGMTTIAGTATDDVGVTRVEFWCDGSVLLGSATTAPYSITYNTATIANGSHVFTCKSYDASGHSTTSAANTATVSNSSTVGPWAKSLGGAGADNGLVVTVDSSGNSIVAGYFQGSVDFGGGGLTSAGGVDLFLAKYSAAGAHLWSKRFGATGNEQVTSIARDASGNIFLGGVFTGTGNFGGASLISRGQQDAFLAKYSPQGDPLWSLSFGGTFADVIKSIAVDSQGNVAATGYFYGIVDFGGTTLTSYISSTDAFVAKYSPTGANLWAKNFANHGSSEYGTGIAVDKRINPSTGSPYDTILLAGYALSDIDLGGGMFQASGFLAKFLPSGEHVWSRAVGTNNIGRPWAMAMDSNGDVAISGDFQFQTDLGGGLILGTSPSLDMFVAKYSGANGYHLWSRAITGNLDAKPNSMTADAQNNIILTGSFRGTYNFGDQSLTTTGTWDTYDGFVAKYSPGSIGVPGTLVWAQRFGGTGNDYGNSVAVDPSGYPVVTGSFEGGNPSFAGQPLTNAGSIDIVLGRINP